MRSAFVSTEPGVTVESEGRLYIIDRAVGPSFVYAKDVETGDERRLKTSDLREPDKLDPDEVPGDDVELQEIPDEDWEVATKRFEIIRNLVGSTNRSAEDVNAVADEAGVHFTTVYNWLRAYQDSGHLSSLIPQRRGRRTGTTKVSRRTNDIIETVLHDFYLTDKQPKPAAAIQEVLDRCNEAKIPAPHPNTVRNRIKRLPASLVVRRRRGHAEARDRFAPIRGSFPDAEFPLSTVQIDHTEADVILVEEQTRLPMGRPWVTLAIDIYTRMVLGIYISMERPSAVAAGLCVARSMCEKTTYLESLGVPGEWPAFGKMRSIHVDNAKEFRGRALKRACAEHGIDISFRPVKVPHYGGHIERLMGALANECRKLDGATFNSPKERGVYDSVKNSTMTLSEFEVHVVDYFVNHYNITIHSALSVSPLFKWKRATIADENGGLMPPISPVNDPERITRDFLPFEERTIQRYGVSLNGIHYFDEVLTPWIDSADPKSAKRKRTFTFRYDPRNLATVYFFDPELRRYFSIPYRNLQNPAISLWEFRHARRVLREEGRENVDEDAVFETARRLKRRSEESKEKTKAAAARRHVHRSQSAKKVQHRGPVAPESPPITVTRTSEASNNAAPQLLDPDQIEPFEHDS